MFGTLVCDLQHEPLTFVENTDPASALSRNRRDKPHASCELCRARKIRCSGQRTGCDRCIAMSVECRYRDRNGRRKRQASTAGTSSTSSSTSATDTKQQGESSHLANPSTTTSEATPQPDNNKERMDDWQMDTDDLFDPALSAQLGSPNHPLDMPGEIAWNSIFGDDHSTLAGAGSVDFTATNSSIPSPTSYEQLFAQPLDLQPGSTALEKLELEAQHRRDSETRQQLQNLALQQPDPFNPSMLRPATAGMMEEEKCLCRTFTATLFEELCAESADNNHAAMDVLLRYFRGALSHCATVLDCERCSASAADSSSNMLLVMAGQYMSTICERMAVCYANIRKRSESRQPSISSTLDWSSDMDFADAAAAWDASSAESTATDGDMWFSTYRIESNEEKLLVLRCLVTVQLNEFSRLLERLKSRAGSRSVCLVLLTDAERRLRSAKSILLEATKQAAGSTKSF